MSQRVDVIASIDDLGLPAWIALMVLGFVVFWPVGLAILAYLIWSGRMGKCSRSVPGWESRMASRWARLHRDRQRTAEAAAPSGNRAFDEYREATLKRLEDEQRAFRDFLERLRLAKDRDEFDQFMAERRGRPESGPAGDVPAAGA
jgi:hypothetical protein